MRVELTPLFPGVTELGANEQFKFSGNPAQESATALLKDPDCGVSITFVLALPLEDTVTAEGLAPSVRLPLLEFSFAQFKVNFTALDIWFLRVGFPTACTYAR